MEILYKGKPVKMTFWELASQIDWDKLPKPKQCKLDERLPPKPKTKASRKAKSV